MPYFKDNAGCLHYLSSVDASNGGMRLLPPDCTGISDAEAEVLQKTTWSSAPLLNQVRMAREVALNRIAGIAGRAARSGDTDTAIACDIASDALLGITSVPAVKAATDDASLKSALLAAYAAIVEAAPINIQNAFSEVRL